VQIGDRSLQGQTSRIRRQRPIRNLLLHRLAGRVGALKVRERHIQRFVPQPLPQRIHAHPVALVMPAGKCLPEAVQLPLAADWVFLAGHMLAIHHSSAAPAVQPGAVRNVLEAEANARMPPQTSLVRLVGSLFPGDTTMPYK
jgi:hypothetical protein